MERAGGVSLDPLITYSLRADCWTSAGGERGAARTGGRRAGSGPGFQCLQGRGADGEARPLPAGGLRRMEPVGRLVTTVAPGPPPRSGRPRASEGGGRAPGRPPAPARTPRRPGPVARGAAAAAAAARGGSSSDGALQRGRPAGPSLSLHPPLSRPSPTRPPPPLSSPPARRLGRVGARGDDRPSTLYDPSGGRLYGSRRVLWDLRPLRGKVRRPQAKRVESL